MKHTVKLSLQKVAVLRALDILEEIYPARIAQKKTDQDKVNAHIKCLKAAMCTLDELNHGVDQRESLL